jgi:hypothetical protein
MTGRKEWVSDDVLTAEDLESYLMDQAVTIWADAASRNSGILAPIEGQLCYIQNVDQFQQYTGSAWTGLVASSALNADKVSNQTVFIQSGTPTANAVNDLWFF